jgi:alanyl-tRNA synthetase
MQEDAKAAQRSIRGFQEKLAIHEAQALLAGGSKVIAGVIGGWDAQGLKAIAVAAAGAQPDVVIALFTSATPAQVVIARGTESSMDAAALLKQLTAKFGGKGGGKADLAQGGGLGGTVADMVAYTKELL